ncbi:VWA domain-containing protein [Ruegeria aquimaris]|uniref:VWA domain-containing protein n=1 Tax=Ruegeria aquimaris TaxID=2984333 RepID=A0ABT3AFD8_9RHOB|nr:VWA domain-containing protein [Ruegeria sp. XHP0148]MCV2886951.1 VWA domain-containing protein [Ruegeria sp. XHP0148]
MKRIGWAALACCLPLSLAAQERPSAILVLDASGSMWGQIEGEAKIEIARRVVGDLLATLPTDQPLGLTVYGHRRKGDCGDIETLTLPAAGNRAAIAEAVAGLKPKGKTPMLDAVRQAAEALRYTEEKATVILVSDGVETCDADPCATAAALEAAGVDFTAHVVGFDIDDPQALAQMQCLADQTGGTFRSAANAEELGAALTAAATVKPDPAPGPARLIYSATEAYGSTFREVEVVWEVYTEDGAQAMDATQGISGEAELPPGTYLVRALRLSDETVEERRVTLKPGGSEGVEIVFAEALPLATLSAPASGTAGGMVEVTWTGPDGDGDYLTAGPIGANDASYLTFEYTAKGNPLPLRLPVEPGAYEIRYVLADGIQTLARLPITVTERGFDLSAPDSAPVGSLVEVAWSGGGFDEDFLTVARLDAGDGNDYVTYAYVRDGNPVGLRMPLEPGQYQLRYVVGQDSSVAVSQPITVTDLSVTLAAPDRVAAGSMVAVSHTGPAYEGDYITFVTPDAGVLDYLGYAYTSDGATVQVQAPDTPGRYELRYVSTVAGERILARRAVVVE